MPYRIAWSLEHDFGLTACRKDAIELARGLENDDTFLAPSAPRSTVGVGQSADRLGAGAAIDANTLQGSAPPAKNAKSPLSGDQNGGALAPSVFIEELGTDRIQGAEVYLVDSVSGRDE